MIRLELIPFLLFALCLCLVSKLSHCSVSNGEAKHHISGQNIIHRKVQQSVNKLTKMWQFSPRAHFSKKQLQTVQTDDKFINLTSLPYNNEGTMNSVQIIVNRGYPVASYSVTTADGYILELHRIPGGKGQTSGLGTGKPVWLQHGLLCSSADWLITPSDQSLGKTVKLDSSLNRSPIYIRSSLITAFILADLGYDVWLGNARGNIYSRKHKTLSQAQNSYWNFSWDEMGKFDIPAVLNFILSKTNRENLIYIGHSMGCSMFFVAMATYPELQSKIELMVALAPATSLAHMTSPALRVAAPFIKHIEFLLRLFKTRAFLSQESYLNYFQRKVCLKNIGWAGLCRNLLFFMVGDDMRNIDVEMLSVIDGNSPAGTSVRTVAQFAMNLNSGSTFIPYDFGLLGNYLRYGKFRPPPYDLNKVKVPVYLFYGDNDRLTAPQDVKWLASKLPNVKELIRVDDKNYNHISFLWGKNNNLLLNDKLISFLPPAN